MKSDAQPLLGEPRKEAPPSQGLFPIQDWVALDKDFRRPQRGEERINQPADPGNKWRFRIHFGLEDLKDRAGLNSDLCGLLKDSGRFRAAGE